METFVNIMLLIRSGRKNYNKCIFIQKIMKVLKIKAFLRNFKY